MTEKIGIATLPLWMQERIERAAKEYEIDFGPFDDNDPLAPKDTDPPGLRGLLRQLRRNRWQDELNEQSRQRIERKVVSAMHAAASGEGKALYRWLEDHLRRDDK